MLPPSRDDRVPKNMAVESTNDKDDGRARSAFYKKPFFLKRDNYKVDENREWIAADTPQEARRQRLLQFQKKCRGLAFNVGRGLLLDDLLKSEEIPDREESMDIDENPTTNLSYRAFKYHERYANRLMMSEWMMEVPQDFFDKWIMVPCPRGKRALLVAWKGATRAYDKRGRLLAKFHSALPGGNPTERRASCTLLDCLWNKEEKAYFVLDVLAWSNQSFSDCETEFRFFWLNSRLREIEELRERATYKNSFPIYPLPTIACNDAAEDMALALANLSTLPFSSFLLDGLLFYHRDGQYTKGPTPLVTWLKPFMLPEVLGVSVPEALLLPDDKPPDGYIDFRNYILRATVKRTPREQRSKKDQMEIDDHHHQDDSSPRNILLF